MVKLIFISLIGYWLTACSFENANIPTLVPENEINSLRRSAEDPLLAPTIDESPRTGTSVELPPTWTPGAPERESTPIPEATTRIVETLETKTYVVQSGDTLAEISERFDVPLAELASANAITDFDHIETGQELIIPSP